MDKISEILNKYSEEIIRNRRKIHECPELGGEEVKTSDFIVEELKKNEYRSKNRFC